MDAVSPKGSISPYSYSLPDTGALPMCVYLSGMMSQLKMIFLESISSIPEKSSEHQQKKKKKQTIETDFRQRYGK